MKRKRIIMSVLFLLLVISLYACKGSQGPIGLVGPQGASGVPSVASQVDYYTINDGTQFIRSAVPFSAPTGSGTVSQTKHSDGSVTLTINNAPAYADCGFYTFIGMLGDLNTITIATKSGSDPISVNIWFDRDNDAEFFTWSNNIYGGVGSDAYILGPQSSNNTLNITPGSTFSSLNPGGGSYTLAQLIDGLATGISVTTRIAIWVGISVNSGNSTATIQSVEIN